MVKKRQTLLAMAGSMVLSAALIGPGLATVAGSTADAAITSVTIPDPGISTLDPTEWASQVLVDQGTVMEGLYGYNQNNQIEPKIASGYKVSDQGRVWTIYLRHNAKWSNGQPVTAEDFYYAWMRLASPNDATGAVWAGVMTFVKNAYAYQEGAVPASQVGLKVVNPYTLQITLSVPNNILGQLAITGSMPLYPPSVEQHPTNWYLPQYFVGDGPYVIKSFVPNGTIVLAKNPRYVGAPGEVDVGNVQQIKLIPTPSVPVEDYLSNAVDVAMIGTGSDYRYVLSHPALKAEVHIKPEYNVTFLEYDMSVAASPLDNVNVRRAVAMAINRNPIAKSALNGLAAPATGFGPSNFGPVKAEHALPYNVSQARAMLAKAGYPNGKGVPELTLYCQTLANNPGSVAVAEAVAAELKQNLNLNFKIVPLAGAQWADLTWGGLNQGIQPGLDVGAGLDNWNEAGNMTMDSDQMTIFPGTMGPASYRQHVAQWVFPTYDPNSIKKYGNPTDGKLGVSFSDWKPLQAAVIKDNAYLAAWFHRQPKLYQEINAPQPGGTTMDLWNGFVHQWTIAKTAAAKHAAWVNAWKFVGNWSRGPAAAGVSLDGQVYQDQHETHLQYEVSILDSELNSSLTTNQANALTAKISNLMMQAGYVIPVVINESVYLEKPWLHGAVANPWSWNNFYQLQYLSIR